MMASGDRSIPASSSRDFGVSANDNSFSRMQLSDEFRINSLNLRDANTGKIYYQTFDDLSNKEHEARIPKKILKCSAVAREINFTSLKKLDKLRVVQRVFLHDNLIEEWPFHFGFVIPGSTNTWQNVIESAPTSQMIPAKILSGNMVIQTNFYDGDRMLTDSKVRIYYI